MLLKKEGTIIGIKRELEIQLTILKWCYQVNDTIYFIKNQLDSYLEKETNLKGKWLKKQTV